MLRGPPIAIAAMLGNSSGTKMNLNTEIQINPSEFSQLQQTMLSFFYYDQLSTVIVASKFLLPAGQKM